jgi:hypothetical protein
MPQRFYEDEYEDAESVYSEEQEDYYEEAPTSPYDETPSSPYEVPHTSDAEAEEEEREPRIVPRGPPVDSWQSIFHSLRGASDPLSNTVTWEDMRSYLDTIRPEPLPAPAPVQPRILPETSARIDRMIEELATSEEAYKVLKASLKELKSAFKEATDKQIVLAEKFAEQEKKKTYKWGPPTKVVTPIEAELKKLDAEILVLRGNLTKAEEKERNLNKELIHDRKYLEEEKEMWEVYKRYTAFEHTLVGPVLQ